MPNAFVVKIVRLPLPLGPLGDGHPEPRRRPIGPPAEFTSEGDALRHALALQNEGYGTAIVDPEGNEWINIKERAIQLFEVDRASLIAQLQAFQNAPGGMIDSPQLATVHSRIAELDTYLRSLQI